MKANEFKFKVTNSDGISAIISLDDLMGYESEVCGVFIKGDHIPKDLRGETINNNSGYGFNGFNESLSYEYIPKEEINKKYLKELKKIQKKYDEDEEVRHINEDKLLCDLLIELGYKEIIKQYKITGKWYA